MMANSSPPRRASTSVSRKTALRLAPVSRSKTSPAEWPSVSLTYLNRSRSNSRTENVSPDRRWRAAASSIFSTAVARLARPVSALVRHEDDPLLGFLAFRNVLDDGYKIFRFVFAVANNYSLRSVNTQTEAPSINLVLSAIGTSAVLKGFAVGPCDECGNFGLVKVERGSTQ